MQKDDHEAMHRLHKREIDLEAAMLAVKARVTALEVQARNIKRSEDAAAHMFVHGAARIAHNPPEPPQNPSYTAFIQEQPPSFAPVAGDTSALSEVPFSSGISVSAAVPVAGETALSKEATTPNDAPPSGEMPVPGEALGIGEAPIVMETDAQEPDEEDTDLRVQELLASGIGVADMARELGLSYTEAALMLKSRPRGEAQKKPQGPRARALAMLHAGADPGTVAKRLELSLCEVTLLMASQPISPAAGRK